MNTIRRNVPAYNIRPAHLAAAAEAGARAKGLPIVRVGGELGYEISTSSNPGWSRVSLFGYRGQDAVVRVWHTEVVRDQ